MADVINVEVYRYQHPNGGAKDWLILYTRDEVEVYYGKSGGTLRRSAIPRARWAQRAGSAAMEAAWRTEQKRREGYRSVGTRALDLSARRLLEGASAPAPAAVSADALARKPPSARWYWEMRQVNAVELHPVVAQITNDLWEVQRIGPQHCDRNPDPDGRWVVHVLHDTGHWCAGYRTVREDWDQAPGLWLNAEGSGRGAVAVIDENRPFLLFLLMLARRFPTLVLADEAGNPVERWPESVPIARETLIALGLLGLGAKALFTNLGGKTSWFVR